jgi:hypothetical protein
MGSFAIPVSSSGARSERAIERRVERLVSLGRAFGHPARARILIACAEAGHDVRRPVVLARELGLPLGVVSYHVRTLASMGLLILRSTATVRGAVAHDYVVADDVVPVLRALSTTVAVDNP